MKNQEYGEIEEPTDQYKIFSHTDRVKWEILNRYYELMDKTKDYHILVLNNRDNKIARQELTAHINNIWNMIKDWKFLNEGGKNKKDRDEYQKMFKKHNDLLVQLIDEKRELKYEGIMTYVRIVSKLIVLSGLGDIERKVRDTSAAVYDY